MVRVGEDFTVQRRLSELGLDRSKNAALLQKIGLALARLRKSASGGALPPEAAQLASAAAQLRDRIVSLHREIEEVAASALPPPERVRIIVNERLCPDVRIGFGRHEWVSRHAEERIVLEFDLPNGSVRLLRMPEPEDTRSYRRRRAASSPSGGASA
jgi:hypothetical protein